MVDHVTKFQCVLVNLVSSRRFILMANYVIYLRYFFLCHVMFKHFPEDRLFVYKVVRFFTI